MVSTVAGTAALIAHTASGGMGGRAAAGLRAQGSAKGSSAGADSIAPSLLVGIYPGGGAGTVGQAGRLAPEDSAKQLAALDRLRAPGRPFVLHLYASYTGSALPTAAEQLGRDLERYAAAGFQTEVVLAYRPANRSAASNVPGFIAFVRRAVQELGSNPSLTALQVTNEVNVTTAPDAADGWYPGARQALVRGIVAAKAESRRNGLDSLRIGFNWAFSLNPSESRFWQDLGTRGGKAFRRSVDWVGLDVYPATWGPRVTGSDLATRTSNTMLKAFRALRSRYMPLAGLSQAVPLHISENGYPTGPGRTEEMQARVLSTALATVDLNRAAFNITDYRWFDLRDADSSGPSFESRYGLLRDDYVPKSAFAVFRNAVATLGARRSSTVVPQSP